MEYLKPSFSVGPSAPAKYWPKCRNTAVDGTGATHICADDWAHRGPHISAPDSRGYIFSWNDLGGLRLVLAPPIVVSLDDPPTPELDPEPAPETP